MNTVIYDENTETLKLTLQTEVIIKDIAIQQIIDDVFKGQGSYKKIEENHWFKVKTIVIQAEGANIQYSGCSIGFKRSGHHEYEIKLQGSTSIIVLLYFFERMIDILIRKVTELDSSKQLKSIEFSINLI